MFSSLRSVARLNQLSQWFSMPKPLSLFSTLSASTPISTSSLNEEVVFNKNLNGRIITLNRPKAFNALNLNMIQQIKQKLQVWEESDQANVIILKSDHPKAFCAGGDVKTIVQKLNSGDSEYGLQFFTHEYQLNHLIGTFRKPIVALMDGITMGGGVGLSVHAPFRVVTEKTVFAMPETAIGFFPDVGATFFLPRLEGSWGSFLGLTGHRLEAGDLTRLGLATHYIPSQQLPFLQQRLSELPSLNWESVYLTLEAFAQVPPPPKTVLEHGAWIQRCFQHTELPAILHALRQETNDTAQSVLASLSTMCPMTLQLTLMQIQAGKKKKKKRDAFYFNFFNFFIPWINIRWIAF
ncbi:hypothetical protein HMI54_003787 [Coelomomyces lativittatus]|nr:hypothetical protein HMI54_003787 [Coelomomyces lativittatus]